MSDRNEYFREYMRKKREQARENGTPFAADTWHLRNPEKQRERVRRWASENPERRAIKAKEQRERAKAARPPKPEREPRVVDLEARRAQNREYMRRRRAKAKDGGLALPSDGWAAKNPELHRQKSSLWRAANPGRAAAITRSNQAARRSTPWGKINNRMWSLLHTAIAGGVPSTRKSKYHDPLGYDWVQLRDHIEALFRPGMSWRNWGEVWELDHVRPLSLFRFESVDDAAFREAWALSNLNPLFRAENRAKRNKVVEEA